MTDFIPELPFFLVTGYVLFVALKFLIPNPVDNGDLMGWVFFEIVEHIIVPIFILLSMFTLGYLWWGILLILIVIIYGRILGSAKTIGDWLRIVLIYWFFITAIMFPTIIINSFLWKNSAYSTTVLLLIIIVTSIIWKRFEKNKGDLKNDILLHTKVCGFQR
jgi:hypothetical protein